MILLLAWLAILLAVLLVDTGFWWRLLFWVELKLMRAHEREDLG